MGPRQITAEIGRRLHLKDPDNHHQRDACAHPAVRRYHERLSELLALEPATDPDNGGGLLLTTLQATPDGYRAWIDGYNRLEAAQAAGGPLEPVKPSASKAAEQALRLAAVMATIEGRDALDIDLVERGLLLAGYYLQTILRRARMGEIHQAERNASEVLEWMRDKGGGEATLIELCRRVTPARHRRADRLRVILSDLEKAGAIRVTSTNTKDQPDGWAVVV